MAGNMVWTTNSGFLTNNKLTKAFQKAAQPLMKFRQFTKFKESFGKQSGQSVNWLKVANTDNYGKQLTETSTMPETTLGLTWGTLTVNEYGNSIPFTAKLEALSEFDIMDILKEGLLDDAVKCMDGLIEREFNLTPLRYVGTAAAGAVITTNGTATATNSSAFNAYHVRKMKLELEKRNVPGWADFDGDYICIASVEAIESLEGALESVNQYTEQGYKKIINGEVGRLYGVRFVKDGFATRYTYSATAGTATAKSWTNSLSLEAYMFGSPTVREAVVIPEEVRMKVVTDYGRSKGIGWYTMRGYAIERSDEPNARIIKWDSAA